MDLAREVRRFRRWTTVWGTRHICPFCFRPLKTFLPAGANIPQLTHLGLVGIGRRDNAQCYVCGSMDRERLVYLYLKHCTKVFTDNLRVLHIAPEPLLMKSLKKQANLHYIRANISRSRADVSFDVTQIPFADDSFDVVIMNHVLEHVHDDTKAMREIHRVTKKNAGFCILQVPFAKELATTLYDPNIDNDEERLQRYGQKDHVRLYGADYPNILSKAGFNVEPLTWQHQQSLFPNQRNRYGLIENEKVFVCKPREAVV